MTARLNVVFHFQAKACEFGFWGVNFFGFLLEFACVSSLREKSLDFSWQSIEFKSPLSLWIATLALLARNDGKSLNF